MDSYLAKSKNLKKKTKINNKANKTEKTNKKKLIFYTSRPKTSKKEN